MSTIRLTAFLPWLGMLWCLTGVSLLTRAQAPALQPVLLAQTTGLGNIHLTATAVAPDGDLYIAGIFSGTMQLGGRSLVSVGGNDGFVARCQAGAGAVQWVQQFGSDAEEEVTALVASNDAVYVGGQFTGTRLGFPGYTLVNTSVGPNGSRDGFVARFADASSTGTLSWAHSLQGRGDERIGALALAGSSLYVGGSFASPTASFGSTTLTNTPSVSGNSIAADGLVLAVRDLGTTAQVAWTQQVTGTSHEQVTQLAMRGSLLYVGGTYANPSGNLSTFAGLGLPAAAQATTYVGCLRDTPQAGTALWVTTLPNGLTSFLAGLAPVADGLYVGGTFLGASLTIGPDQLLNQGNADTYLAFLDDTGATPQWRWGRSIASPGLDHLQTLTTDGQSLYAAGHFYHPTLRVGAVTFTNVAPSTSYAADIFVARLGPTGNFVEAQHIGGDGHALAASLTCLGSQLYLGGELEGQNLFNGQAYTFISGYFSSFLATMAIRPLHTAAGVALPGLALLPNPAHSSAELRLPTGKGAAPFGISILDALGRVVLRREAAAATAGQTIPLELAGLAPGVYAVRVQQGVAQAVQKLVVE